MKSSKSSTGVFIACGIVKLDKGVRPILAMACRAGCRTGA
jgi:hypothetical protein